MDTYGFVPNSPLLMRQPPPTQKGKVTEKDIMHCLPNNDETGFAVLTMFDLTRFFPDVVSNSHHIYFPEGTILNSKTNWLPAFA